MWIVGGVLLAVAISYSFIFFVPKSVQFSYAAQSCTQQLVLAPDVQKVSSSEFDVRLDGAVRLGNITLATTQMCFEPKQSPSQGVYTAAIAPFGGLYASKQFAVEVPASPVVKASEISGKTISPTQPLNLKLTSPDIIHSYELEIANKQTVCTQSKAELSCDIERLDLAHGAEYTAAVYQEFKDQKTKIAEGDIETLLPLLLSSASVSGDQVLYDAPTSFALTFDRPVARAEVTLTQVSGTEGSAGAASKEITTTSTTDGQTVTVAFDALNREEKYQLIVNDAVADNGSSIAEPIVIPFSTSGGPKVSSVSVGAHSVARNARIIVTFDQPIDESVDIAALARVAGVAGSVSRQSATQLAFSIQGGDCTAFGLEVDKGVKSGSNGELSKEAWKFNARTICGSSWVIGSSVQGRAMYAYSFGSGPTTVLFTGGIHGSERSAQQTMQAWVAHLQAYGDIVPAGKRVVIVPNTNPDGIAAGTRNNSRNVNLGRNFPTANWSASIETASGTLPTGGGTSPGSEPETAALISLTRQLKPRLSVSFHAQGRLVGANKFADSVAIGTTYANMVGYQTMFYNAEAVMGYAMTGEMEDWMGEEMGIPAILIELPSPSGNYLSSQLAALKKMMTY